MIQICDSKIRDLNYANELHFNELYPGVLNRLKQSFVRKAISKCQFDFITDNLERILKGFPEELVSVSKAYKKYCEDRRCKNIKKGLSRIFGYNAFSKKHPSAYCAYILADRLGVRVCPYCNRQYTFTVISGGVYLTRPEFDHFFSQADHPLLTVSFFNLIPSCKICNSTLKHTKKFNLENFVHPYQSGFYDGVRFDYQPHDATAAIGLSNNLSVKVKVDDAHPFAKQLKGNIKVFRLEEIYQGHSDVVAEIIRKFYMSDGKYLKTLMDNYAIGSYDELYRLAFGNYYLREDLDQRILSKLMRDIVSYLDFVLPVSLDKTL